MPRGPRGIIMSDEVLLLLVEDEPIILMATQDDLEEGGFAVVTATNGAEALAVLGERHSQLAGVITDIRLGDGPNGWDVARHARELNHEIPVVYISGDSASEWPVNGVPRSVVIPKPFVPAQILTAISNLLNDAITGGS
jgi:CheY-like chemotaxis protein